MSGKYTVVAITPMVSTISLSDIVDTKVNAKVGSSPSKYWAFYDINKDTVRWFETKQNADNYFQKHNLFPLKQYNQYSYDNINGVIREFRYGQFFDNVGLIISVEMESFSPLFDNTTTILEKNEVFYKDLINAVINRLKELNLKVRCKSVSVSYLLRNSEVDAYPRLKRW